MALDQLLASFQSPEGAGRYSSGPPLFTPGFADMHVMTAMLLSERMKTDAHLLVLGAGGGLELAAFGDLLPAWRFTAVDPAQPMLDVAKQVMGDRPNGVAYVCGYIDDAPPGPFDGGVSLLTLHFLEQEARIETLRALRDRLKPGAPFVAVHTSIPDAHRSLWLDRYAHYATLKGVDPAMAHQARAMVSENLPVLSPQDDEDCFKEAGFSDITPFYHALTWRGWVALA